MKNEDNFNTDGLELVPLAPEDEAKKLILEIFDEANDPTLASHRSLAERGDFFGPLVQYGGISMYDHYKWLIDELNAGHYPNISHVDFKRVKKIFSVLEQLKEAK